MGDGISESYSIPHDVAITSFRLDIFLVSRSTRQVILVQVTVAFEDRVTAAAELKSTKYRVLRQQI
jgi:hypothetical protein